MGDIAGVQWLDGALSAESGADPGFLHGLGVFETLRVSQGLVLRPDAHLARMCAGIARLKLPAMPEVKFRAALRELARSVAGLSQARVRLTWTPGVHGQGSLHGIAQPYVRPGSVRLSQSPFLRNERSALTGVKSISYAENLLALQEAKEAGADEPIFANSAGEISEGATSNLIFAIDGELLTPPLASGCLPGTARAMCIEWGRRHGLPVAERTLDLNILPDVQGAAVTSALKGVVPVSHIDGRELATAPLIAELCTLYDTEREAELIFPE